MARIDQYNIGDWAEFIRVQRTIIDENYALAQSIKDSGCTNGEALSTLSTCKSKIVEASKLLHLAQAEYSYRLGEMTSTIYADINQISGLLRPESVVQFKLTNNDNQRIQCMFGK